MLMNKPTRRRGSNATEFALGLPFILAMFAGVIDGCWYLINARSLSQAVRSASRVGTMVDEGYPPTGDDIEATALQILEQNLEGNGVDLADVSMDAEWVIDGDNIGWLVVEAEVEHQALLGDFSPFNRPVYAQFQAVTREQPP